MECVDLCSDDVVLDEVLCVEKFEVDVFCSFARTLSCSYALACCRVGVNANVNCSAYVCLGLRCSPSFTPVQIA